MLPSQESASATRATRSPTSARPDLQGPAAREPSPAGAEYFLTCTRWDHAPLTTCGRSFFSGSKEAGYQRFRTTSQNYYAYDTKALAVGESNQGIVSEKSKWIHQKQTMCMLGRTQPASQTE